MDKRQKILAGTMLVMWAAYALATLAGADKVYNVLSPVTGLLSFFLIYISYKQAEKYRYSAAFIMLGIGAWIVADIMLFIYTYVRIDDPYLIDLSDKLYLAPNYFFGVALTAYILVDFKKQDIFRLLINTFILAVTGFITVRRLYLLGFGINTYEGTFPLSSLLYMIAVIYVLALLFFILTIRGAGNHTRAGYIIFGAVVVYNIFEMRYTYYTAGGLDAESIYIDIIYMACVCAFGLAFADPTIKQAAENAERAMKKDKEIRSSMGAGWIFGLILIPVVIVNYCVGILSETEFYILIVSGMGYLIMWKTQQTNELTQELLKKQREENEKLGQWVDYQEQELKVANEQLERVSYKDTLTGLYNRKYSRLHINQLIMENPDVRFAMYSMDINYFKPINDNYGLEAGDKVLMEVAGRLSALADDKVAAFRLGVDEFMLVYKDYGDEEELQTMARRLKETMDAPMEINGNVLHPSLSIGVATYPGDTQDLEQLAKFADSARRSIKHRHSRTEYKFYDQDLIKQMSRKRRLEVKLQSADYDRDFKLYYQPQVDCATEQLIGMEALIRWIDPVDGFISPAEFIPLAEEMGLMENIGDWVNRTAMRQIREWNEKYDRELVVGINVSPLQLRDPDFAEKFLQLLGEMKVPAKWLDVEITEGYALNSSMASGDIITKLKKAGITFSVDDFGTGYASFTNMLDFTFDRIKIAKELVDDIVTNRNAYVVVKVIVLMARGLNLSTIAEGVETKEQLDILRELECGQIQGYYFGRPLPADQFEEKWLNPRTPKA